MGKAPGSPGLGELLRVPSPGSTVSKAPVTHGFCGETALSADGEVLEAKSLEIHDEKQRMLHGESPWEREMDAYCCRGGKRGEVIALGNPK